MHVLNVVTVVSLLVLVLVGSEFSVSAFLDPGAWRLAPEPQSRLLSHLAAVLGKVMPFWYAAGLVLLGLETWLHRHTPGFGLVLAATTLWLLATLASLVFLVPLNNRVIEAAPGWPEAHRRWDRRHRVRVVALAVASILFTCVVVR